MESNYAEVVVKRERRYIDLLFRAIWVAVIVWGAFLLFPINGMIVFMYLGLHATLIYFFWNNYIVEYEYIYCDGQLDIDIIRNMQKRKHIIRVEMEDVIFFSKYDEDVEKKSGYKMISYISNKNSENIYYLLVKKHNNKLMILFEPNEKMVKNIKYKTQNKNNV